MIRLIILTVALVFNVLCAQTSGAIINRNPWPAESFSVNAATFAENANSHEQQLYAAQIRSSYRSCRDAATTGTSEQFEGRLPADMPCIIHFNNGLKASDLTIRNIDNGKLIVQDRNGRQQDILIVCITQIEIAAADFAVFKNESGIPDTNGWLKNLLKRPRNFVLSLGWLTIEEKIELLQSRFVIA